MVTQFLVEEAVMDIADYQDRLVRSRLEAGEQAPEGAPVSPHEQALAEHRAMMAKAGL